MNGSILWANLNLLFWLSLMPFTTAWMGENHFAAAPWATYALDLLLCAIAYSVLQAHIVKSLGPDSSLHQVLGKDIKGKASIGSYVVAIPLALPGMPWLAGMLLVAVALLWLIPDRRIEKKLL